MGEAAGSIPELLGAPRRARYLSQDFQSVGEESAQVWPEATPLGFPELLFIPELAPTFLPSCALPTLSELLLNFPVRAN